MALSVRRVEIYHLQMVVKCFEDSFAGDPSWERGDGREDGLRHDACDAFVDRDGLRDADGGWRGGS